MKTYFKLVLAAVVCCCVLFAGSARAAELDEHLKKAREVVAEFEASLKGELKTALTDGGPVNAIGVCSEKAAHIASKISRDRGWTVRRVSTRQRNPLNRPDEYEYSVLRYFAKQEQSEKNLERYETVIIQGVKEFRYMKAITIKPICLNCHGKVAEITDEVKTELKTKYPHDQATGYSADQLRGAFSIRIPFK